MSEKRGRKLEVANKGSIVPDNLVLQNKQEIVSKTIAVLPFVNMSASKENEYFSDGITEEIINALAKIKRLKVTSRTSSFFFKNKNISIREISKELNVSAILEGSVRLSGNTIRITAQLIHAEEDFHFWSETWDRKLENIFVIQDEISLLIADKLREHFGHFEIQEHLVEKQTDSIDAYGYYLQAKFHANKWNPTDVKTAILLFEKALKLDPDHTESHLGLADCYSFLGQTGFMPFEEAWGKTIQFTNKAHELNDRLSGVHYQMANQAFFIRCDYEEALIQMKKAIDLNPNNAEAHQFMSFLFILAGIREKSLNHLDIALSLDPLSEETQFFKAYFHYMIEDFEKSLELLDKCLDVNNKNIPAHSVKSICLLKLKRYDDVIGYFDKMPPDIVVQGEKTGAIALAYAFKKDTKNTQIYLNELLKQAKNPNGFTADSYLFLMYAIMGENDKAFDWVAKAIERKSSLLLLRFADPLANSLKDDSRYSKFQRILFHQNIFFENTIKKKELLDEKTVKLYSDRLLNLIKEKEPYLNPGLSLRLLANQIDIHPNQLSWLLNESMGKNFNEFINHYRIEFFKILSKDPKNSNITIMGLAYDSGFNSKTVFNTYFKKETGLTPLQFLKQ